MTSRKRRRLASPASPAQRPSRTAREPAANETVDHEHRRLVHELEVHQLELETQNRALRDSQLVFDEALARYRDLYDYAPVAYLTLDRFGVVHELNLAAAALLGKERRLAVGSPLRIFLSTDCRARFDAHLRAALNAPRAEVVELTVVGPGEGRAVEMVSAPSFVQPGAERKRGLHSALIEVTGRRAAGEASEAQRAERLRVEGRNHAKQEFLRLVSHELRSPLAPMMMWVRALRSGGASDALRLRAVDALETCIGLQVTMIEDLIDVARAERSDLRLERRPMDLLPVVGAIVDALAPSAVAKDVEIAMKVDPGPILLSGDAARLRRVVTRLVSNAINFTRAAGHVVVSLHKRGAWIELRVRDDGDGIDAAHLGRVFEPFEEGAGGGASRCAGVGLALVRHLVEAHGGSITAESAGERRGATFIVTLPALEGARSTD